MSAKTNAAHTLHREMEAAKVLLATYQDILGEDTWARHDMVEGETNLHRAMEKALARVIEVDAMMAGIEVTVANLQGRARRLKEQRDNLRTSIAVALELAELKRMETPLGTMTLKAVAPRVEITDETLIPAKYWVTQDPTLDKKALQAALKDKEQIPGAALSNGSVSLQVTLR